MRTTLYLIRHAATPANLAVPARLQGQRSNPPLAPLGVKQAEATRDFLATVPFAMCYSSPLTRAVQTAEIVASPHNLTPLIAPELTECDVGNWEGQDWGTIREREPDAYAAYMANPGAVPYRGGESFADVAARVTPAIDRLLTAHAGTSILVVSHHVVNRTYLAGLLGLAPSQARRVSLDNCGISIVTREDGKTAVATLNAAFHLAGVAA